LVDPVDHVIHARGVSRRRRSAAMCPPFATTPPLPCVRRLQRPRSWHHNGPIRFGRRQRDGPRRWPSPSLGPPNVPNVPSRRSRRIEPLAAARLSQSEPSRMSVCWVCGARLTVPSAARRWRQDLLIAPDDLITAPNDLIIAREDLLIAPEDLLIATDDLIIAANGLIITARDPTACVTLHTRRGACGGLCPGRRLA